MRILTTFKFRFEAIVADIGKQENGNFIHIFGEVLAQKFGKYTLF